MAPKQGGLWNPSRCLLAQGAPFLGEHTDEVLKRIAGLSDEELDSLREQNIIQSANL